MNRRQQVECEIAAEAVRASGRLRFRATGTSMLPAIWPGDVLDVVRVPMEDIGRGDVVLFQRQGRLFAHRVQKNVEGKFITQGDSNSDCDLPVTVEEFLGRVVRVQRCGRGSGMRLNLRGRMWSGLLRRDGVMGRLGRHLHAALRRRIGQGAV